LAEQQAILATAATKAAAHLTHFCVGCGQDALRQATVLAADQLAEHEVLLRDSARRIATQLADLQAAFSPSAGRIAVHLSELQQNLRKFEEAERQNHGGCSVQGAVGSMPEPLPCTLNSGDNQTRVTLAPKPFGLPWLLAVRKMALHTGQEVPLAFSLLFCVALCVTSTFHAIARSGGEDLASFSYGNLIRRAAWWLAHRVFLGLALLLLSDAMASPPLNISKYDAMGWPMWSTLLALSSQLCFFVPAAAVLNTAVAAGSGCHGTPSSRRLYASLSREVHAAIVGCFVSDWLLFPTNLTFFGHHILGLGIIYGVWSMVLGEAKLLSENSVTVADTAPALGGLTSSSFWLVTGLSVASMEASSFFYNLYSVTSFGSVLNLSLFAVFTYSNLLSMMCVLAQHPWGTSMKLVWAAGSLLSGITERAQVTFPHVRIPSWLASKTTSDSVSYTYKSCMITVICLARHYEMWMVVREQVSTAAVTIVGATCVFLAAALVWRLKAFERQPFSATVISAMKRAVQNSPQ